MQWKHVAMFAVILLLLSAAWKYKRDEEKKA
jgi:hypothetical protein